MAGGVEQPRAVSNLATPVIPAGLLSGPPALPEVWVSFGQGAGGVSWRRWAALPEELEVGAGESWMMSCHLDKAQDSRPREQFSHQKN